MTHTCAPDRAGSAAGRPALAGRAAAAAAAVIVVGLFCAPMFLNLRYLSREPDWLEGCAVRHFLLRQSVLEHGQLPLWCPFLGGGQFTVGDPDDPALSPFSIFTIALGDVLGLKACAVLAHLAAVWGMYYFCRSTCQMSRFVAVFCGLALTLSSWIPGRILGGNWTELAYVWWPLLAALFVRARSSPMHLFAGAGVLALLLPQAKTCWAVLVLYLAMDAALRLAAPSRGRWTIDANALAAVAGGVMLAAAFAAAKVLPMASLIAQFRTGAWLSLSGHAWYYSPASIWALPWATVARHLVAPCHTPQWHSASTLCLGPGVVVLSAAGVVCHARSHSRHLCMLVLSIALMMAWRSPVDVFRLLWLLPAYNAITVPAKYFDFFVVFYLVLFAGLAVSRVWAWAAARGRLLVGGACALALGHLFVLNVRIQAAQCPDAPLDIRAQRAFFHTRAIGLGRDQPKPIRANAYHNARAHVGAIDWRTRFVVPEMAVPRFFVDRANHAYANPRYRGEAYFADSSDRARLVRLTSNALTAHVTVAQGGRLVLNQNCHAGWRCSAGAVKSHEGRLAVDLARKGSYNVHFHFRARSVCLGIAMSLLAAALAVGSLAARSCPRWARVRMPVWAVPRRTLVFIGAGAAALGAAAWMRFVSPRLGADDAYYAGLVQLRQKNPTAAEHHFRRALALRPRHPAALLSLAGTALAQGRMTHPERLSLQALLAQSRVTPARLYVGWCCLGGGRAEQALGLATQAAAREPYNAEAHFLAALAHEAMGRKQEAVRALSRAVDLGAYMLPEFDDFYLATFGRWPDRDALDPIAARIEQRRRMLQRPPRGQRFARW